MSIETIVHRDRTVRLNTALNTAILLHVLLLLFLVCLFSIFSTVVVHFSSFPRHLLFLLSLPCVLGSTVYEDGCCCGGTCSHLAGPPQERRVISCSSCHYHVSLVQPCMRTAAVVVVLVAILLAHLKKDASSPVPHVITMCPWFNRV